MASTFDGVLADFNTSFIARCITVTERDLFPPRPFDIPTWNYPEHYGYTREEVSAVWTNIKADPTFWQNLPVYPTTLGDIAYLEKLKQEGHDVYFVTNRMGVRAKLQTERWLRRKGFEGPTVLLSAHKGLMAQGLELTHYIDDRTENVYDVSTTKTKTFLMDRPWNMGRRWSRNPLDVSYESFESWKITVVNSVVDMLKPATEPVTV